MRMLRRRDHGLTLVEALIAIVIIGIVAAIAIPQFVKYARRAKSSEAYESLDRIAAGAKAYFVAPHTDANDVTLTRQYPAAAWTTVPSQSCCEYTGDVCNDTTSWDDPLWRALGFRMTGSKYYYRYSYQGSGTGNASEFSARALGDLDCDGIVATFTRQGSVNTGTSLPVSEATIIDPTMEIE